MEVPEEFDMEADAEILDEDMEALWEFEQEEERMSQVEQESKRSKVDHLDDMSLFQEEIVPLEELPLSDISVTSPTGFQFFLRERKRRGPSVSSLRQTKIPLLSKSIEELQRDVDSRARAQRLLALQQPSAPPSNNHIASSELWVDKYSPQRYTDLLSDERTNRAVLSWIKEWDTFVFPDSHSNSGHKSQSGAPRATPITPVKMMSPFKKKKEMTVLGGLGEGTFKMAPERHRPENRVILLSGPPGLGKTTLAHLLAKQSGYKPVEINASDDRSASVLKERIINALTTKNVQNDTPNLLILDEIDGVAGEGAMEFLVNIITADANGSKSKLPPINRPIICICNDLYTPALRRLRPLVKIFYFNGVQTSRLTSRLQHILRTEGLARVEDSVLLHLCHLMHNDVRSALNTLQFVVAQAPKSRVTRDLMDQLNFSSSVASTQHMSYNDSMLSILTTGQDQRYGSLLEKFGSGDRELLIDGVWENYLRCLNGSDLPKAIWIGEWAAAFDFVGYNENYSLNATIGVVSCLGSEAALLKNRIRQTIQFPMASRTASRTATANRATLRHWKGVVSERYILEELPLVMKILDPGAAVNQAALSSIGHSPSAEQIKTELVQRYLKLGLKLEPPKGDPNAGYLLEPPLNVVTSFVATQVGEKKEVEVDADPLDTRPATHQLYLLLQPMIFKGIVSRADGKQSPVRKRIFGEKPVTVTPVIPKEESHGRDFFGRKISKDASKKARVAKEQVLQPIRYKHNEGFTNAVRRKVFVGDF